MSSSSIRDQKSNIFKNLKISKPEQPGSFYDCLDPENKTVHVESILCISTVSLPENENMKWTDKSFMFWQVISRVMK